MNKKRFCYIAIFALIIIAYWQLPGNDFINYDDPVYVTENPCVSQGITPVGVAWAFSTTHAGNWHPLTWLSHMLDVQLFGLNAAAHHVISLLFHLANSLLLFTILTRATGAVWRSCFVAMLFALHPLHVESVAWVAERKDLISTFFGLLTILSYVSYVRKQRFSLYLMTQGFFILGLMAKPMLVSIPFILLVLDYWPLKRLQLTSRATSTAEESQGISIRRFILEKLPFLTLASASSIITYYAQKGSGAVNPLDHSSIIENIGNALIAYVIYIIKTFWPSKLSVFYPFDAASITLWPVIGATLCLVAISFIVIWKGCRQRYLVTGWFWFIITLLPVIGLIRVGSQSMADRYTYVPLVGLFIIISWGVPDLLEKYRLKKQALLISSVVILSVMMILTSLHLQYWRNSVTLFNHAIDVTKNNWFAHHNLGTALLKKGRPEEALTHFLETVRISPSYVTAYNNIGIAYEEVGNPVEAIKAYKLAIRINPAYADAHYNLGLAYLSVGNKDLALAEYQVLKRISSANAQEFLKVLRQ